MTKPPFADLCILNFDQERVSLSDFPDNDQHIHLKLQQMMKKRSEEAIYLHQNYHQLLCDIKKARKKKRAIRKVLLKDHSLYSDKRFVLELVKACSRHLQYASQELKQDFEVVMAAVVKSGSCLKYLNSFNALLDNFTIGYHAVKSCGASFQYLSFNLRNDRRVVMRAVESKFNYSFLPDQFKNDREIMIKMIKLDPYHVSKEFHNDFLDDQEMILRSSAQMSSEIIPKISTRLQNNIQFIVAYTKLHPHSGFEYFPSKFQDNFEFVKRLVASHMNFSAVPEKWKSNEEIMKSALKRNQFEFFYFSKSIWENRKFLLEVAELSGVAIFKAKPVDVTIDRELVRKIILANPESYRFAPMYQRDFEITRLAIKLNNPRCIIESIPSELYKERELIIESLQMPPGINNSLDSLPEFFRKDKEIIIMALKLGNPDKKYHKLHFLMAAELLEDKNFMRHLVEIYPALKKNIYLIQKHKYLCE